MYLIDTNIFLEILLDQERAVECQKLIESLQDREVIFYVSSFTMHSIEVVLDRKNFMNPLLISCGTSIKPRDLNDLIQAPLKNWRPLNWHEV
ncbi:MAG: PIN domain-containing protein [Planctomycetota bacterium]